MKKVLVFGITDNPGGVESVIMNYYRKLNRNNIQFEFLCNTEVVAYEDEILSLGGKIHRVVARSVSPKLFYRDLKTLFTQNHFDAIWVNVCNLANISYLKYAKKYGIKTRIIHSHNSSNMDSKLRLVFHKINRFRIGKLATDYWSCGELASKWFYTDKIINSNQHKIIKNAIDVDKFMFNEEIRKNYRKQLDLEGKFVIGHVGRFHFQKNHLFLIDVFNEVYKKHQNAVLILIGQGEDEDKVKQKVANLGLNDVVKFLGVRNDVNNLFQAMDLMLFPSLFEGLPVVMVEAQASGLPIVASDTISQESKIVDNVQFISLNDTPLQWAEIVLQHGLYNQSREQISQALSNTDFDIKTQISNLSKIC